MTSKCWKRIFILLMAGSILAALKLIFFDYTMDEEYQLMMGYRTLRGDALFREMWEPHQTSAFLCTGLMWVYKTLTGTYTGILLYLRVCTTLIQAGISLYLYRVLARLLDQKYALLCALIYFNMVPKIIQIPDFSNMQLWFFTLTVLCLMHGYLLRDREQTDRPWLVFAAGICMALEVLSYPSCVILFPFFLVYIYRASGQKKWRDTGLFTGACALCALVWLCIILRHVDPAELLRNVRFLLDFDLTHELSGATQGKLPGIFTNLLGGCAFLAPVMALSLLAMIPVRKKKSGLGTAAVPSRVSGNGHIPLGMYSTLSVDREKERLRGISTAFVSAVTGRAGRLESCGATGKILFRRRHWHSAFLCGGGLYQRSGDVLRAASRSIGGVVLCRPVVAGPAGDFGEDFLRMDLLPVGEPVPGEHFRKGLHTPGWPELQCGA